MFDIIASAIVVVDNKVFTALRSFAHCKIKTKMIKYGFVMICWFAIWDDKWIVISMNEM